MKKILLLTMAVSLLLCTFTFNVSAQNNLSVYINGKQIQFDVQPQIVNGRTMVPMRMIFEELGAVVEWVQETQTIIGKKDDTTIVMQIDNKELSVNETISTLDVAPSIIDGRTLVPVRAIAESLGVDVLWYGDITTVAIYNDTALIKQEKFYNLKGECVDIDVNFKEKYTSLGWASDISKIETVCMYAPDGRTKNVYIGNVETEISVGWYLHPVVTMYTDDGRTSVILQSEVDSYKQVGWFTQEDKSIKEYSNALYSYLMNVLKRPSSLEIYRIYSGYHNKYYRNPFTVCFEISAMNGFGGYTRAYYTVHKATDGDFVFYNSETLDISQYKEHPLSLLD